MVQGESELALVLQGAKKKLGSGWGNDHWAPAKSFAVCTSGLHVHRKQRGMVKCQSLSTSNNSDSTEAS